jgi:hypothetical protein
MAGLGDVLEQYVDCPSVPPGTLGYDEAQSDTVGRTRKKGLDKEKLKSDLEAIKRDNTRYFLVCVVMVGSLFLASIAIVLANLNNPGWVKVAMGGFGASAAGLITVMTNLWRTKSSTEVLLLLIPGMDADALKTIILILAKKL